jgi:hypothetical protein
LRVKYIFVTYINRSGSTYFVNLLNRYQNIFVCIEGEILVKELLADPEGLIDPKSLYKSIAGNDKMMNWLFNPKFFDGFVQPVRKIDLFTAIVDSQKNLYKPGANTIVFKAVELLDAYDKLKSLQGEFDFRYVSIVRDCRAVFSSQNNTYYRNKRLNSNPMITSYQWNYHVSKSLEYSMNDDFSIIKYEELVTDAQNVTEIFSNKIELNPSLITEYQSQELYERLPKDQKKIHEGIKRSPQYQNIDKWKTSLSKQHLHIIEIVCGSQLSLVGYQIERTHGESPFSLILKAYYKLLIFLRISKY